MIEPVTDCEAKKKIIGNVTPTPITRDIWEFMERYPARQSQQMLIGVGKFLAYSKNVVYV